MKKSEPFKEDESLTLQSFSDIYSKIKYEHFASGEIVFSHGNFLILAMTIGDFGSKFYIIIKGSVSVQIPIKQTMGQQSEQQIPSKVENSPIKRHSNSKKSMDETIQQNEEDESNPYGLLKNGGGSSKLAPLSYSTDLRTEMKLQTEHQTLSPHHKKAISHSSLSVKGKQSISSTSSL